MKTIPTTPISGWAFTAAVQTTSCPKCGAKPGEYCKTPKGRKADTPHDERSKAYSESIGPEEYKKRHSRKLMTFSDVVQTLQGGQQSKADKWKQREQEWRAEVYDRGQEVDPDSEYIWTGVAVGWAIGKGMSIQDAHDFAFYLYEIAAL